MAYSDRFKENSLLTSSLNGLTVQTLRTTGFNLSDFAGKKYYPIALLFDGSFMAKWFEYKLEHPDAEWTEVFAALESSYKPDGVRPLSAFKEDLTPVDQESLAKFIGNTSAYFGVMAPAWVDSPAWLLSLISIYKKNHTDKNFWYFPLQASKFWYKGFVGTNLAAHAAQLSENTPTQLYATLFRKADLDLPELLDLLHKDDSEKVPFTQYSQWPAPISGEVARTYQGVRTSNYIPGATKNLIVNPPEGMQPLRINPVKATDNYLIPAGNNSMVFRVNQMLPSGYTPEPGIYTFSFYAKYDGEVIGQPSNRFPQAVAFNWNGTIKTYPLYNSWKRYYISGPLIDSALSNYYVSISASGLFPPVRIAGLLLEKSPYPSTYNPVWHTIGSTYTGPKQFMPVLYQLPLVSNASATDYHATLKFTEGTIIYKKYIEDHGFSEHWDSLGFSDSSYLNWGFNSSGHPELNISLTGISPVIADNISLAGHEDNWTLNILRFKADKAQWTVYAVPDVSQPLIDLSLTTGSILPATPQTCSTSAYITPNNPASEYAVRYNLALGSRLHKGDDPTDLTDPYNQFFSDQETEIEPPDNSGYEDLVYCNWLLTDDEVKQLVINTLFLKVQEDDHNQELSIISGSINQSDFGRAYIAGVK